MNKLVNKLTKGDVAIGGLMSALVHLVESWDPGPLSSEKAYRDSLLKFLRTAVPEDCRVEREYRHGGTTTDIFISWKGFLFSSEVFIEIKRNLQKKASFDRLIGQLEGLEPDKRKILLVLVGNIDESLLSRLKTRYAKFTSSGLFGEQMHIVVKTVS
jgi:hypothetical protein